MNVVSEYDICFSKLGPNSYSFQKKTPQGTELDRFCCPDCNPIFSLISRPIEAKQVPKLKPWKCSLQWDKNHSKRSSVENVMTWIPKLYQKLSQIFDPNWNIHISSYTHLKSLKPVPKQRKFSVVYILANHTKFGQTENSQSLKYQTYTHTGLTKISATKTIPIKHHQNNFQIVKQHHQTTS